jgi:hypothetical protein
MSFPLLLVSTYEREASPRPEPIPGCGLKLVASWDRVVCLPPPGDWRLHHAKVRARPGQISLGFCGELLPLVPWLLSCVWLLFSGAYSICNASFRLITGSTYSATRFSGLVIRVYDRCIQMEGRQHDHRRRQSNSGDMYCYQHHLRYRHEPSN